MRQRHYSAAPWRSRETTRAAGPKMIVLGVDGMDPLFLEAHWDSLPNLNRLRKSGDFKRLGTTVPPQSPVAWSSVITGMDPGGHGIFDFIHRNPSTRMPVSSMGEASGPGRTLTIGPYVLPSLLPRLGTALPKLQLYVREDRTSVLLDKLAAGELDILLLAMPYDLGDVETMAIADDPTNTETVPSASATMRAFSRGPAPPPSMKQPTAMPW